MNASTKEEVLTHLRCALREKARVLSRALADSEENASGDETKSEGKYDTRAVEAAYLAEAQKEQLTLTEQDIVTLDRFIPETFDINGKASLGALVEVNQEGEITFYFLLPTGGGLTATYLGCDVTVITPDSTLYQSLSGMALGETLSTPSLTLSGLE